MSSSSPPPLPNPLLVTEIVALVFSHLSAVDIGRAAAVCRLWRDIAAEQVYALGQKKL